MAYRQGLLFDDGLRNWGGRRRGAGRKRLGRKRKVRHGRRKALDGRFPFHVVWNVVENMLSLRKREIFEILVRALERLREKRQDFRVIQFSIQASHIHFIVEADSKEALSRGMQGLGVSLAKGINRFFGRKGRVFDGRYFSRALRTPREVKSALVYVLQNFKKHGSGSRLSIDPISSGIWFDGWEGMIGQDGFEKGVERENPLGRAETWLLREGWKRHGIVRALEGPKRRAS